jgi:hypothetical protein
MDPKIAEEIARNVRALHRWASVGERRIILWATTNGWGARAEEDTETISIGHSVTPEDACAAANIARDAIEDPIQAYTGKIRK